MIVDLVIVVLALVYAVSGYRNGALVGVLRLIGFAGGAFAGAQLARPVSERVSASAAKVPVALLCVIGLAIVGQILLVRIGIRLRDRLRSRDARRVDSVFGAALGVVAVLLVTWVLAVPLASSSYPELSSQVRQSRVVGAVNAAMPDRVSQVYSSLRATINRSGFPSVFGDLGRSPVTSVAPPDDALLNSPVLAQVRASIVKVTGVAPSCDRGLEGSAFVFAPQHVMTNAHVVAGTSRVQVVTPEQGSLAARVVGFDPGGDVAVLYVPGLTAAPLAFAPAPAVEGADALVVGYPEDGPFDVRAARVRQQLQATGRDIYDENSVTRSIYSLRALVRSGNSGGPLLSPTGQVLGVVFATALDVKDTGFALTNAEVAGDAAAGAGATAPVGTGACTAG